MRKNNFKRLISFVLTLSLVITCLTMIAYAQYEPPAISYLNLKEFSAEELLKVTPEELYAYLEAYKKENNITNGDSSDAEQGIMPLWASGDEDNFKTHEFVTFYALALLIDDKGFWEKSEDKAMDEITKICIASGKPDDNTLIFEGHFYDPDTEQNYLGFKTPTAKTWCVSHFNNAVNNEKLPIKVHNISLTEIGNALHFLQDACEPHHAANITNVDDMTHALFENHVEKNISKYIANVTVSSAVYNEATSKSAGDFLRAKARVAKAQAGRACMVGNTVYWDDAAKVCIPLAISSSAALVYKFAKESKLLK